MLDFAKPCQFAQGGACNTASCTAVLEQADLAGAVCNSRKVAAHEHLFHELDEATHFFEVLEGSFCIYKLLPDGRRYIVAFALPGDLVGFGADEVHALGAEAIKPSVVRPIECGSLDQIIATYPGLATKLLHHAKQELADAQEQLVTVARKSALEKLATFLVKLSKRNRERGFQDDTVNLPMTRSDIADFLGLTIETVSRTLSKLKRAGIIDLPQSSKVIIRDSMQLEMLAEV